MWCVKPNNPSNGFADRQRTVLALPCEHQVLCVNCGPVIRACPLCGNPILSRKPSNLMPHNNNMDLWLRKEEDSIFLCNIVSLYRSRVKTLYFKTNHRQLQIQNFHVPCCIVWQTFWVEKYFDLLSWLLFGKVQIDVYFYYYFDLLIYWLLKLLWHYLNTSIKLFHADYDDY